MSKVCFVISPMGDDGSPVRERADYVLDTYIKPACEKAGFEALRADQGVGRDISKGTTTALENAPMAVAYMGPIPGSASASDEGASCWNPNVMIEIGYRLASRLSLLFLCDLDSRGRLPDLPLILNSLDIIGLPRPDPQNPKWDNRAKEIINRLGKQFEFEKQAGRILASMHPVAAINAANSQDMSLKNLLYTAASVAANDLFFGNMQGQRLVGRTMDQFLSEVRKRMHPAQWSAFERDQNNARNELSLRATNGVERQAVAKVPIVFESHENAYYNHRAFLPIIVQDYRPAEGFNWYNLRVLYLNVTSATDKVKDNRGEEYYVCRLDPASDMQLEPLKPYEGIRIFLSYRRDNSAKVAAVYNRLVAMKPYVAPFIDLCMEAGDNWMDTLGERVQDSELCFLFLDEDLGPGQKVEVDAIQARIFSAEGKNYPVVPVRLTSAAKKLPWINKQWVELEDLIEDKLRSILWHWFPERCPIEWKPREGKQPPPDTPNAPLWSPSPSPGPGQSLGRGGGEA
jgi:hypothetical protein